MRFIDNHTIWRPMGLLQDVSLLLYLPRQTTCYRRLGRGPISLSDSKSGAFSRMLQAFRFSITRVHTLTTKGTILWELGKHAARAQIFCH